MPRCDAVNTLEREDNDWRLTLFISIVQNSELQITPMSRRSKRLCGKVSPKLTQTKIRTVLHSTFWTSFETVIEFWWVSSSSKYTVFSLPMSLNLSHKTVSFELQYVMVQRDITQHFLNPPLVVLIIRKATTNIPLPHLKNGENICLYFITFLLCFHGRKHFFLTVARCQD